MQSRYLIPLAMAFTALIAATPAYPEEKPDVSREELRRIQEELKGAKNKASEATRKERSVLSQIEALDKRLAQKRAEVKKVEGRLGSVSAEIARTEAEAGNIRARLGEKEQDMAARLRAMYITGRAGGPWALLLLGDYGSFLKRYSYLSAISRQDKRLMDDYKGGLDELGRYKEQLKLQRESYDKLRKSRDMELKSVQADEGEKKRLLASVRRQKSSYEAMARELEESGRRMQELLKHIDETVKTKPATPNAKPAPALKAGLDWPVSGEVVGRFGRQKHPEYDTYIFKKGIEVRAALGTDVHAVEAAEVVYANWFKGLGLVAILRHGGDYYTVYAHLAEIRVKTGDSVTKGQVIAGLGDTGAPEGPSLYFELRKGSEAQDPLKWLKKR